MIGASEIVPCYTRAMTRKFRGPNLNTPSKTPKKTRIDDVQPNTIQPETSGKDEYPSIRKEHNGHEPASIIDLEKVAMNVLRLLN